MVAQFGLFYHGLNGGLILLIAFLSLRLRLTAFFFSGLERGAKRRGDAGRMRTDEGPSGE